MKQSAKIVAVTATRIGNPHTEEPISADDFIVYCARVSNPKNQFNLKTAPDLIRYLTKENHWSPFEMVNVVFEIKTTRAISAQILRHRSFSFQEFSQRYATVSISDEETYAEMREKGATNRQGSTNVCGAEIQSIAVRTIANAYDSYYELIDRGVAPESARFVLPLAAPTTLYMNGTVRSWIHYLRIRTDEHTQEEHRQLAELIRQKFVLEFPEVSKALNWW